MLGVSDVGEIANCPQCNAVFVKTVRSICSGCYAAEEKAFETVYNFLRKRKNREATLVEIVEATGVSETLITKFIRENRLRKSQFPNIGYPCEKCGKNIVQGKLCNDCGKSIMDEYAYHEEVEKRQEKRLEEANKQGAYYSFDKD